MKNAEFKRLLAYQQAAKLSKQHRRIIQSKRSVRGLASGTGNAQLKTRRLLSPSAEKLGWSPFKYRAINKDSNLITQPS